MFIHSFIHILCPLFPALRVTRVCWNLSQLFELIDVHIFTICSTFVMLYQSNWKSFLALFCQGYLRAPLT